MKAVQLTELTGPQGLRLLEVPSPEASHMLTPGNGVIVEVHAAGVAYPDLLMTRGEYQLHPPLPFVPGAEVAGVVRQAPDGAGVRAGDRVAACCVFGGFAEVAVAPEYLTVRLPESLDFAQGSSLIVNYHTAYFSLVTRGRVQAGEHVLVHGAAGGIGTAAIQVAKGLGAHVIAVVSDDAKARVAHEAGADDVVRSTGDWKDEARAISGGGVDVVLDPVGGDRFTDSLRTLRERGRALVVGFTGGSIPTVKVNRLLMNNIEVVGAAWGEYALAKPQICRDISGALRRLVDDGFVRPLVGARFALEDAAAALRVLERREALGKVILDVRQPSS